MLLTNLPKPLAAKEAAPWPKNKEERTNEASASLPKTEPENKEDPSPSHSHEDADVGADVHFTEPAAE